MKKTLYERVYMLADKYRIEQTRVHGIISAYIQYCRDKLARGERVNIVGMVSIIPKPEVGQYTTTFAYECREVAKMVGCTSFTVHAILSEYLDSLIDDVLSGEIAELRGLVTVKPYYSNRGVKDTVNSAISATVKSYLDACQSGVESVRVHSHPLLKYNLRKGAVV